MALDVEMRYRVSFWDALILQAAAFSGASILLLRRPGGGQHYGSIQVVNPLARFRKAHNKTPR